MKKRASKDRHHGVLGGGGPDEKTFVRKKKKNSNLIAYGCRPMTKKRPSWAKKGGLCAVDRGIRGGQRGQGNFSKLKAFFLTPK